MIYGNGELILLTDQDPLDSSIEYFDRVHTGNIPTDFFVIKEMPGDRAACLLGISVDELLKP